MNALLTPRWSQLRYHAQQHKLWTCPSRFIVIEAGRRSGKTVLAKYDAVRCFLGETDRENWLGILAAPTRDQARAIFWEDLKALIPSWSIDVVSESYLSIISITGNTLQVVGLDKPQRVEGRPIDKAWIDELADCKSGVWDRHLRPALSTVDREGKAWLFGVPRPSTQFAELARIAQDPTKSPEWAYFYWDAQTVVSKEEIESARATMDPLIFEQEYTAKRVNVAGRAYYTFDRSEHLFDALPYSTRHPLIVTMDFNVSHGAAVVVQEHTLDNGDEMIDVLGEVAIIGDSNTRRVCRKVIADWGTHEGEVYIDGDPSGGQRRTSSDNATDWTEVQQILGKHFGDRLSLVHKRSAPTQRNRVNAVNARLKTADGKVHTRLCAGKTDRLARDFDTVVWIEGAAFELNKDTDKAITHWSDAFGYYVERRFPVTGGSIVIDSY